MAASKEEILEKLAPIHMVLHCPECRARHIDEGEFATKPHHTHSCQACGLTWRPAVVATVGVQFLPGFKNDGTKPAPPAPVRDEAWPTARWDEVSSEIIKLVQDNGPTQGALRGLTRLLRRTFEQLMTGAPQIDVEEVVRRTNAIAGKNNGIGWYSHWEKCLRAVLNEMVRR